MFQAFITGITMGLYLAVSVGPILFTVIKQSLENGSRGGFSFVAGIWLSDFFFVVLSNKIFGEEKLKPLKEKSLKKLW